MGVPDGSCAVDEYHDVVTGLCQECAVACRNVKKPDSQCLHYCSEFYSRLSASTLASLPNHSGSNSMPLLLGSAFAGVLLIISFVFIFLLIRLRRHRMQPSPPSPSDENYFVKYRRSIRRQRRFRHQNGVQETRKEESELSVLYVSPCSSLPPSSESSLTAKMVNDVTRSKPMVIAVTKPTKRSVDSQTNHVTVDAVISSPIAESFGSLDETFPKLVRDPEQSLSKNLLNSRYSETAEIVLRLPNQSET